MHPIEQLIVFGITILSAWYVTLDTAKHYIHSNCKSPYVTVKPSHLPVSKRTVYICHSTHVEKVEGKALLVLAYRVWRNNRG